MTERDWQDHIEPRARAAGWLVHHNLDSRDCGPGQPDMILTREVADGPGHRLRHIEIELKLTVGGRVNHRTRDQRRYANWAALAEVAVLEILLPDDADILEAALGISVADLVEREYPERVGTEAARGRGSAETPQQRALGTEALPHFFCADYRQWAPGEMKRRAERERRAAEAANG